MWNKGDCDCDVKMEFNKRGSTCKIAVSKTQNKQNKTRSSGQDVAGVKSVRCVALAVDSLFSMAGLYGRWLVPGLAIIIQMT